METGNLVNRKLHDMILHAIDGESDAIKYYSQLAEAMSRGGAAAEDVKTVQDIVLDEAKHRRLFEELYQAISGAPPAPRTTPPEAGPGADMRENFKHSLRDELGDAEFYRGIYFALQTQEQRDILFEIMTDEMRHAQLMSMFFAQTMGQG